MVNKDKIWLSKKEYDFLVNLRNNPPNLNKFIEHPDKKDMESYEYHLLSVSNKCNACGIGTHDEFGVCNNCGYIKEVCWK